MQLMCGSEITRSVLGSGPDLPYEASGDPRHVYYFSLETLLVQKNLDFHQKYGSKMSYLFFRKLESDKGPRAL